MYLFIEDDYSPTSKGGKGCDSVDISNGKYFNRLNYIWNQCFVSLIYF